MIDYCTVLFDERERAILPLHINSLRYWMPEIFNIKISVRPEDSDGIALCDRFGVEVLKHPIYTQSPSKETGLRQAGLDLANRMDLLMKSCTSDWVFLSHLDIIWTGNTMSEVTPFMTDEYGVLGHHPHGCMAVNRRAYNECHFGFWPMQFCGQKGENDGIKWVKLVGKYESIQDQAFIPVCHIDIGILIEMEMQVYTYKWNRGCISRYHHIGGASHHGPTGVHPHCRPPTSDDLVVDRAITDRVNIALNEFKEFA